MIEIIKDKELIWETDKYDVILVGTSIYCMLTGGFQSKLKYKYPAVEEMNNKTKYGDIKKMGLRQTLYTQKPIISLMYMCRFPAKTREYIDWDAFEKCLQTANAEFQGMNAAATVIGSSNFDGNADKNKCIDIIEKNTGDLKLTLYDYHQVSRREEEYAYRKWVTSLKEKEPEKYNELFYNINEELKKIYLA